MVNRERHIFVGSVGTVEVSGDEKLDVTVHSRPVDFEHRKRGRRPKAVVALVPYKGDRDAAYAATVYLTKTHVDALIAALKAAVA
jgi:hypothetical protein